MFKHLAADGTLVSVRRKYALRRVQDALFSRRARTEVARRVKTARPVLHNNRPSQRTTVTTYKKATTLGASGIFGARSFKKMQKIKKKSKTKRLRSLDRKLRIRVSTRSEWRTHSSKLRAGKPTMRGADFGQPLQRRQSRLHKNYFVSSAG